MKNVFLSALALLCAFGGYSQKVVNFTTSATDTLWVQEQNILRITKVTAGSELEYLNKNGDYASAIVRERSADTANVASTVVITFAGVAGSVDSIEINGVEVMNGAVAFTSTIAATVALVEDSIDNNTQSPVNFSASNVGAVMTISAPAVFGDTANGYVVTIYTSGGITVTTANPTVMAGGFTVVRNIITLTDRVFNIEGGAKALNADRVEAIYNKTGGSSVIWYEGSKFRTVETTDNPAVLTTAINAL